RMSSASPRRSSPTTSCCTCAASRRWSRTWRPSRPLVHRPPRGAHSTSAASSTAASRASCARAWTSWRYPRRARGRGRGARASRTRKNSMSIQNELVPVLKKLRLSGMLKTLDLRTKEAVEGEVTHSDFLFRICCDEVERRDAKQLEQRLRRASFESTKRLED